jgi:hypothetical protein
VRSREDVSNGNEGLGELLHEGGAVDDALPVNKSICEDPEQFIG